MRPGIGRNASCASGDCLTSWPEGHSRPRELRFSIYSCTCILYVYVYLISLELDIKKEGERIHSIFQDPLAQHLLVCMDSRECYYVGRSRGSRRVQPRPLHKVKGHWIESVAWNKVEQTENSTGPILMGTNNGEG